MIRDDQGLEISEILSGTSFQDEDRAIAVSGDQGEVQENVEGQNPIEQGEDMRTFEEKFAMNYI